jgi:hypothetical protein
VDTIDVSLVSSYTETVTDKDPVTHAQLIQFLRVTSLDAKLVVLTKEYKAEDV